jgi:hypothetical protein
VSRDQDMTKSIGSVMMLTPTGGAHRLDPAHDRDQHARGHADGRVSSCCHLAHGGGCLVTPGAGRFTTGVEAVRRYWAAGGKGVLGLNLEGPFINPKKRGARVAEGDGARTRAGRSLHNMARDGPRYSQRLRCRGAKWYSI